MREYMDAVSIITENLGTRYQAEKRLGILLPPSPSEDPLAVPPRDILNAYACKFINFIIFLLFLFSSCNFFL